MPEINVKSLRAMEKPLSHVEIAAVMKAIEDRKRRYYSLRNRMSRRIYQLARWLEQEID